MMIDTEIEMLVDLNDVITYALYHNGMRIIRSIDLKNNSDEDKENLILRTYSDNQLIIPFEQGIQMIKINEEIKLTDLKVLMNGDYLALLTERTKCTLTVELVQNDVIIAVAHKEIVALAYDEWPGMTYYPDYLAAYVTPNHPMIAKLLQSTSQWLEKWTGIPSLEGYQCQDSNRVKDMAAAAYAAIQECNITYANPPASFEEVGQRVRLCDAVMEQHLGTCMDMTLLYTSVLESIGLNPILVMVKGHIFAGVWLIDQTFADPIIDDPSQLEKRIANGIHEMIVVECTAMCSGKTYHFKEAMKIAQEHIKEYENFRFAIDIVRARHSGVRPLPARIKGEHGYEIQHDNRTEENVTSRPDDLDYTLDFGNVSKKNNVTKQMQWERKLLDLSMRNMLINMRLTKSIVPLLTADVAILEDALADGEEFQVTARPKEWELAQINVFNIETVNQLGPYKELIELECKHKRIPTIYSEKELNYTLTKMYRLAKTSLEENGASTLYLALGLLRWFEKSNSDNIPRYAPIILIPIEIIRKSASKGYTMRMRDEDAQINITLLEFLKQNFDIEITGLNPIPTDEHGLDMNKIFAIIRHNILDETMWDVVEAGFIGNFSFSQFVIWNDIHNKTDFLDQNKIVHSLMNGVIDWDCTIPNSVETDQAYLPIIVDDSQLRAINMAANDVSFVLHGPPGTGKSQTITAMIANALAKGKTVLFVAEKMAALQVVQKRLQALGIGDFCLELHSNKATKKSVLDQLKHVLEINDQGTTTEYQNKIQDIQRMKVEIDGYVKALHEKRPFGKSLRELIDIYETIPVHEKEVIFDQKYVGVLTQQELDNQKHILERLVAAGKEIGHPAGHPLQAVHQSVYSQQLKVELNQTLNDYLLAIDDYRNVTIKYIEMMQLNMPKSKNEWEELQQQTKLMLELEEIPQALLYQQNLNTIFVLPINYLQLVNRFNEKRDFLKKYWNENFLHVDVEIYRKKYDDAGKKLFGKGKALNHLKNEIQAFALFPVIIEKIPFYLSDIESLQMEEQKVNLAWESMSYDEKNIVIEYKNIEGIQNYQKEIQYKITEVQKFFSHFNKFDDKDHLQHIIKATKHFVQSENNLHLKENKAVSLLQLSFDESVEDWLQEKIDVCHHILKNASYLKDWIIYRQFDKEAREAGLAPICDAYEKGLENDVVIDVYLSSVYKSIVLYVIESEPALNSFTGVGFNERIHQFKKLDLECMELTKQEMYYQLAHNLPNSFLSIEMSRELNILRRAISSNGRGISIRSLFEQIPHVLKRLTPCMLMSPISVAQYISTEAEPIDIVIFDEASQLPTCKAVGVLARGKNAVIVGDPNQMPPTSFFAGNTIDEDNLDIEDLDSILDDCLALGMPQTYLKWHYRSKHESLIAFSNYEFYENGMLTFPSKNDRERHVSLKKVSGYFERGKSRVNHAEAIAIVEEIKRRYQDENLKKQSIGVVTFNINQQNLIQDMLANEYQKDAAFDAWANCGEEELFVKNLENVQGDERDVILFSIAFGPDSEGKLSMNFGPLNKEGGWKRLNVAVSRARREMIVYTIMSADMIDLRRTKSKGVEALRDFLEFAEKGYLQNNGYKTMNKYNQGIIASLCSEIDKAGFEYQTHIGHSHFKIDIAVMNPYNKDEYLLGIMLDGDSYCQTVNTRDREISQFSVLNSLGWDLHRIWTIDWWDNRDKEIKKVLELLAEKRKIAEEKQMKIENSQPKVQFNPSIHDDFIENHTIINSDMSIDEKSEPIHKETRNSSDEKFATIQPILKMKNDVLVTNEYKIMNYTIAEVEFTPLTTSQYIEKQTIPKIVEKANIIIEIESPISYECLVKKILRSFDIARSSAATIEATDRALKKVKVKTTRQKGMKFFWKEGQDPENYHIYRNDSSCQNSRNMNDISQQELKNAVCCVLLEKGSMDKTKLLKEAVHIMGYKRTTAALLEAAERGLKYGRRTNEIIINDEKKYSLSK